jgi:hypothetical protein
MTMKQARKSKINRKVFLIEEYLSMRTKGANNMVDPLLGILTGRYFV